MHKTIDVPPSEWDYVYDEVYIEQARYPLPIRSIVALLPGYKFSLPLRRRMIDGRAFVRPIWKPRNDVDFLRVQVERVDDDRLMLELMHKPEQVRLD